MKHQTVQFLDHHALPTSASPLSMEGALPTATALLLSLALPQSARPSHLLEDTVISTMLLIAQWADRDVLRMSVSLPTEEAATSTLIASPRPIAASPTSARPSHLQEELVISMISQTVPSVDRPVLRTFASLQQTVLAPTTTNATSKVKAVSPTSARPGRLQEGSVISTTPTTVPLLVPLVLQVVVCLLAEDHVQQTASVSRQVSRAS